MKDHEDAGFTGKVAIISGGGAAGDGIGNGRAAAILLARAGAKVMVADLDPALAGRTVEMIEAEGGTALAMGCDVTVEAECRRLVEAAVDALGDALGPFSRILLVDGTSMIDHECHRAGISVLGRICDQCEAADHLSLDHVVDRSARCVGTLGRQNPEIVPMIGLG